MKENQLNYSFLAACQTPVKLLLLGNKCLNSDSSIVPYHIQYIPTNRCNLNCPWCSCKNIDRSIEMNFSESVDMINYFSKLGTKAITITGGGEPTLYEHLLDFCKICKKLEIKIGLVSNCVVKLDPRFNDLLTWLRISNTSRDIDILDISNTLKNVDIGISYTVSNDLDMERAQKIVKCSRDISNITHIRFVQNILDLDNLENMKQLDKVAEFNSKVFLQYRNNYDKGKKHCYVSKLKPLIGADGYVYPCCGVQYALYDMSKSLPVDFRMCYWSSFHLEREYNGSNCYRCYYNEYNKYLKIIKDGVKHKEFI